MIKDSCDLMRLMSEPVEIIPSNKIINPCQIGCVNEATHQIASETSYYCCYGCYIAYLDVAILDCAYCSGYPCVCEEMKKYKAVSTIFMWLPKENTMINIGYIPTHPKHKRSWDNAIPLR